MTQYRYTLEKYNGAKTRFKCPSCNKTNAFTRYIDIETNEYLNENVGCCNRVVKCGYHYKPKQYFQDSNLNFKKPMFSNKAIFRPIEKPKPTFISKSIVKQSLTFLNNNFLSFLEQFWNKETALMLANKYNIGTSNHWNGSTIFWQVDSNQNVRSGKVMLYDSNCKRVKKPYNHINWMHKVLKLDNFNLEQCFFGEHLINQDFFKPIAIVESEKTAIIASVFLPEFIWLACGSVNNLNESRSKVLQGRSVVLFPDLGCFDLWNSKIPKMTKLASFRTSTLLEDKATDLERANGYDLADYLLRFKL